MLLVICVACTVYFIDYEVVNLGSDLSVKKRHRHITKEGNALIRRRITIMPPFTVFKRKKLWPKIERMKDNRFYS